MTLPITWAIGRLILIFLLGVHDMEFLVCLNLYVFIALFIENRFYMQNYVIFGIGNGEKFIFKYYVTKHKNILFQVAVF